MNRDVGTFIVGVVLVVILVLGYYAFVPNCPEEEPKARLNVEIYQWAENIEDSSELFFDYNVYNYGDIEAKNIEIRCNLYDENDNKVVSVKGYFGNLASNSVEFGEIVTDNFYSKQGELFSSVCFVESCDNCEVLWKNIPSLIEVYQ